MEYDRRYEFYDVYGNKIDIVAGSWEEAEQLAQRTMNDQHHERMQDFGRRVDQRTDEEIRSWRDFSAHKEPRDNSPHIPWGPTDEAARGIGVDGGACAIDDKPWLRGGAAQATRSESVSDSSILATLAAVLVAFVSIACLCSSCGDIARLP